jgi:deoxycytidylate deaminase
LDEQRPDTRSKDVHVPVHLAQIKNPIENFDFCNAEIVIGLVCAVGTDYNPIRDSLAVILEHYGYKTRVVKISSLIPKLTDYPLVNFPEITRINGYMDAGNQGCRDSGRKDLWALAAVGDINAAREKEKPCEGYLLQKPLERIAHIILTLKRPEEIATLRKIYGDGFFVVGVFATQKERLEHLLNLNAPKQDAVDLIARDTQEIDPYGQQTRETFHLSDVFVRLEGKRYISELTRFFDLVFSNPHITPTQQEHAMFLAYASSLRSGQLGRQVGAAISSRSGDLLSVGCNDVPKPGGGLYWPGPFDRRDSALGFDTNDKQRDKIVDRLIDCLPAEIRDNLTLKLRNEFRGVLDITEYGRAVHAEMDALLTCARSGVSPVGTVLSTTTFPCHNCTRHIVAAGISRVIYIEPYAKSRAEELHQDAIVVEEKARNEERHRRKVPFTPFVGVGPRRYFDLFSLTLSRGFELIRKSEGKSVTFSRQGAYPRVPMSPLSYIQKEAIAIKELDSLPKQLDMFPD